MTDTPEVHRTIQDFRIVHAAVIPTKVLPAPQGSTIIPDRARLRRSISGKKQQAYRETTNPFPNIFPSDFS